MANNKVSNIRENAISELIRNSISKNEALVEVDLLFLHLFNLTKKDILINPSQELPDAKIAELNKLIHKRIQTHAPIQYLINKACFMGYDFYVDENVLIPRPETELLVNEVIKLAKKFIAPKIIDVGTGSGCIACMISKNFDTAEVVASDISKKALDIAKINAKNIKVDNKITFIESDIFSNVSGNLDIIVSNPPYIPVSEKENLQIEVVSHEPHLALFANDEKGIYFYKKIITDSKNILKKGGYIAFEIGISQAEAIKSLLEKENYTEINIIKDYSNIERIITAKSQ